MLATVIEHIGDTIRWEARMLRLAISRYATGNLAISVIRVNFKQLVKSSVDLLQDHTRLGVQTNFDI